jgi:hypothetical protein
MNTERPWIEWECRGKNWTPKRWALTDARPCERHTKEGTYVVVYASEREMTDYCKSVGAAVPVFTGCRNPLETCEEFRSCDRCGFIFHRTDLRARRTGGTFDVRCMKCSA